MTDTAAADLPGSTLYATNDPGVASNRPPPAPVENAPPPSRSRQELLARAWVTALDELMKIGLRDSHGVGFHYGNTPDTVSSAVESAVEHNVDIICLYFGGPEENGPTNIVAIVHGKHDVAAFENCEVWAFKTWLGAELIAASRRFSLAKGTRLKGKPNNLDAMRARRVAVTWDRLRRCAFEIAGRELPVPPKRRRAPAKNNLTKDATGGAAGD